MIEVGGRDNMAWLGNLKISSKLLGSFYVIGALMVSVGILSLLKLSGFQSQYKDWNWLRKITLGTQSQFQNSVPSRKMKDTFEGTRRQRAKSNIISS